MKKIVWLLFPVLFVAVFWSTVEAQSSSSCSHVTFYLETSLPVDRDAICAAAEPWAEEGASVFVYLTDIDPLSEEVWYTVLDQIETEAGIREPAPSRSFDADTVAFEATTTSDAAWATTLTYGSAFFDTGLDELETAAAIKGVMAAHLDQGEATTAFTSAISQAYEATYPPSVLPMILVALLIVLGLVLVGLLLQGRVGDGRTPATAAAVPTMSLPETVMKLLDASGELLQGNSETESPLFQLYQASGGAAYARRTAQVRAALVSARVAHQNAATTVQALRAEWDNGPGPLTVDQVKRWELVYLTLVGSRSQMRPMANGELQSLLKPSSYVPSDDALPSVLYEQLQAIEKQERTLTLRSALDAVDPQEVDRAGVLEQIALVKQQITVVDAARREAPELLAELQATRRAAGEEAAAIVPFGLMGGLLFGGIDDRLLQLEEAASQERYVDIVEHGELVRRDLAIVNDLLDAAADYVTCHKTISSITGEGLRPALLSSDLDEIGSDIEHIVAHISAGDYAGADAWIDELDADSMRALTHARSWHERYLANEEGLRQLREGVAAAERYLLQHAKPAWEAIGSLRPVNWQDIAGSLEDLQGRLIELRSDRLPLIAEQNSLAVQNIAHAEALLAQAHKQLDDVQHNLHELVERQAMLTAAKANLPAAVARTEAELERVEAASTDTKGVLPAAAQEAVREGRQALYAAQQWSEEDEYLLAMEAVTRASHFAAKGQAESEPVLAHVERLQEELALVQASAEAHVRETLEASRAISPLAQSPASAALLRAMTAQVSLARQKQAAAVTLEETALMEAVAGAAAAYVMAEETALDAKARIEHDGREYEQLQRETQETVRDAERAIVVAARAVSHPEAGGAGEAALRRAERTLRGDTLLIDASRQALKSAEEEARLAAAYAREAEMKAEQAIAFALAESSNGSSRGRSEMTKVSAVKVAPRTSVRAQLRNGETSLGQQPHLVAAGTGD